MTVRVPQRCACGGEAAHGGECARCRARRVAADSVERTLREPGRPLDAATRLSFKRAWGHDFAGVRVHAGETGARSAAAVGARAYTVGRHIAFAHGLYEPTTARGRRLLAHELTHVRQQDAAAVRNDAPALLDDPAAEAEAERAPASVTHRVATAVQRQPDEPPVTEPGASPTPAQTPPAAAPPPVCEPARALTWADFTGTVPASATLSALTRVGWRESSSRFRAVLDGPASWVLARVRGAGARATNGCAPEVADCERVFDGLAPGSTATVPRGAPTGCDAAAFTDVEASARGECDSVIGVACDADAVSESARLLRHEQLHFDIGCTIVRRANAAVAAGRPVADVRTWVDTNFQPQQDDYDDDTDHGCKAAEQATWQTQVAGGLTRLAGP